MLSTNLTQIGSVRLRETDRWCIEVVNQLGVLLGLVQHGIRRNPTCQLERIFWVRSEHKWNSVEDNKECGKACISLIWFWEWGSSLIWKIEAHTHAHTHNYMYNGGNWGINYGAQTHTQLPRNDVVREHNAQTNARTHAHAHTVEFLALLF